MRNINNSNFHKLLARCINGTITGRQFAEIFANLLDEVLDTILINLRYKKKKKKKTGIKKSRVKRNTLHPPASTHLPGLPQIQHC